MRIYEVYQLIRRVNIDSAAFPPPIECAVTRRLPPESIYDLVLSNYDSSRYGRKRGGNNKNEVWFIEKAIYEEKRNTDNKD